MKKAERILGIAGASLLILGVFFKYNHWPTAGIQITLAVMIFNFGYLPLQFNNQWRESRTGWQKFYSIFKFLTIFLILTGFIFKTMHWPGAGIGLMVGSVMLPLYIIVYFVTRALGQGKLPFMLGDLIIAVIAYLIYLFVTSTMISSGAVSGYILLEDQYLKMNEGLESSNRMIYESIDSITTIGDEELRASIAELRALGREYLSVTDSVKESFYRMVLRDYYRPENNHLRLRVDEIANWKPVFKFFIEGGAAERIKAATDTYREGALAIAGRYNLHSSSIGLGLETGDQPGEYGTQTWISYIFDGVPVGSVIDNLSLFKQMMLLTENTVLNGLISRIDLSEEVKLLQDLASRESEKAMQLKENEIVRVKQEQELQAVLLEQSESEIKQNRMMAIFAFGGVALVLFMFSISTRAYVRKQRDNRKLAEQKDEISEKNEELNQQNEEIAAQRDEIEAQRDMVFRQKEHIEKAHQEIQASIDYATRLQSSILPGRELLKEHFQDHFVLFRPKQKVSGDFYWWTRVEDRLIIAAADCTGHGVPGAFMSMLGVSLLREIVNKEFITQPGVVLRRLRKEVIRSLDQKGEFGEQKDGMDIALVSIDIGTLKCEYAGANNPIYLVREGRLIEYKPDRMPVSYYQRMDKFTTREIQLQRGDLLYLFSDGYADQFGGEQRKKFKYKAFQQLLVDHSGESMEQQHRSLVETIVAWQGDYEQIDDMVVVGIKI
jgi:serine phosphatase RsbU (regulator of sigma subunit)